MNDEEALKSCQNEIRRLRTGIRQAEEKIADMEIKIAELSPAKILSEDVTKCHSVTRQGLTVSLTFDEQMQAACFFLSVIKTASTREEVKATLTQEVKAE